MSRVVTYLTTSASDVNEHIRMSRGMLLMMDMLLRGFDAAAFRGGENVSIQMDYALESPDEMPAGACQQNEIDTGDEDNGMPGYCVFASQISIRREE